MDDKIANQIASYRTRLTCLDQPEHRAVWENQAPLKFTQKVAEARALTDELVELAGEQSAPITGHAQDKDREESDLERVAWQLARAVVLHARDTDDLALAAKYDLPLSGWRAMRDEALIQRARLLEGDAAAIVAGPDAAEAADYGITAAAVAALTAAADDYEALIAVPQDEIADRSALTAALPVKSRAVAAKYDEVADLLPQFTGTAAGDAFVAAFRASSRIVDRGRGPDDGDDPTPPPPPPPQPSSSSSSSALPPPGSSSSSSSSPPPPPPGSSSSSALPPPGSSSSSALPPPGSSSSSASPPPPPGPSSSSSGSSSSSPPP